MTNEGRIKIAGDSVAVTLADMQCFPDLYCEFVDSVEEGTKINTLELEGRGESLMKGGFADTTLVYAFFYDITKWGGGIGNLVRSNLRKNYSEKEIAETIDKAGQFLKKDDIKGAISTMTDMKEIGMSFGSMTLRMLSPQKVCAFGGMLETLSFYPRDADGYVQFCADCEVVAAELNKRNIIHKFDIENSWRKDDKWLIADVEAVVFYQLRQNAS